MYRKYIHWNFGQEKDSPSKKRRKNRGCSVPRQESGWKEKNLTANIRGGRQGTATRPARTKRIPPPDKTLNESEKNRGTSEPGVKERFTPEIKVEEESAKRRKCYKQIKRGKGKKSGGGLIQPAEGKKPSYGANPKETRGPLGNQRNVKPCLIEGKDTKKQLNFLH